jgi:hypothetical protein
MRVVANGPAWATIGAIIAIIVLILAIIGIVGAIPNTPVVVFGLIAALAVARLV